MAIPFLAQEISGLATPTYNSGATNKKYVDDLFGTSSGQAWSGAVGYYGLSSNLDSRFAPSSDASWITGLEQGQLASGAEYQATHEWMVASGDAYSNAAASAALALYTSADVDHDATTNFVAAEHVDHVGGYMSGSLSGSSLLMGGVTVTTILDEDDMASNSDTALATQQSIKKYIDDNSGSEVSSQVTLSSGLASDDDIWHDGSETDMFLHDVPQTVIKSGSNWQATRDWMVASGGAYTDAYAWMIASGEAISHAVASANALKTVNEGYASVADGGTIAHNLGAQPTSYNVMPSGSVCFAIAATADATNITVRMSAGGTRGVHWRAEL